MIKSLGIIMLTFVTIGALAQTKIASEIPDSYKIDLADIVNKKGDSNQDKEHKKRKKVLRKQLKKELKLNAKLYKLKYDSIVMIRKLLSDSAGRNKIRKNSQEYYEKASQSKWIDKIDRNGQGRQKIGEAKQEISKVKELSTKDSSALVKEGTERILNEIPVDASLKEDLKSFKENDYNIDSVLNEPPTFALERFQEEFKELEELEDLNKELMSTPSLLNIPKAEGEQVKGQDFMKKLQENELVEESLKEAYQDYFAGNEKVVEKSKEIIKVSREKKNFKEVVNSFFKQDLKSVDQKPGFKERFYLAGFIQIDKAEPLIISTNPSIGYRITERITLGTGGNYSWILGSSDQVNVNNSYAYQAFFDYRLSESLFMHSELEREFVTLPETGLKVKNNFWVGLGKYLNYKSQLKANVLLLYKAASSAPVGSSNIRDRLSFRFGFIIN
ncbi:MAG TPA: hypothetical protein PKL31_17780 [Fulvivirga sp.]|nr:hypothetical protein [Fulvivirga sp.]